MSKKILIVEDDEALREWISYELAADYEVTTAADGLTGLNMVQSGNWPDLMILDVMMPGLTGFEVAKKLRNNLQTAGIPIIFLTASTSLNDKLTGFESGGLEYLIKPVKSKELLARIKAILRHAELNRRRGQAEVETEMRQAADIQCRLMPQGTPQVAGLDLCAYYQPARLIGGDFFDFIIKSDQQLVFTIADVTGKGLPAALIMSSALTALWGAAHRSRCPKAVLERVNSDLYDKLTNVGKMVTTFVGWYNPQTRQVTYANAGHAPVILCRAGEQAHLLEADGPPLGVLPTLLGENHCLTLNTDDVLLMGSDGLSEAENPTGERFGYERLLKATETLAGKTATEIAAGLFEQVTTFASGCEQLDDQTLIVLKGERNE